MCAHLLHFIRTEFVKKNKNWRRFRKKPTLLYAILNSFTLFYQNIAYKGVRFFEIFLNFPSPPYISIEWNDKGVWRKVCILFRRCIDPTWVQMAFCVCPWWNNVCCATFYTYRLFKKKSFFFQTWKTREAFGPTIQMWLKSFHFIFPKWTTVAIILIWPIGQTNRFEVHTHTQTAMFHEVYQSFNRH